MQRVSSIKENMQGEGWEKIYKEEALHIERICMRYLNDEQLAKDMVQDAFVIAIEKEKEIKHAEKRRFWVKKVAINEAFQYLKKNKKFSVLDIDTMEDVKDENDDETENDKRKIIENAEFSKEEITKTVNDLPTPQKAVFTLFVLEDYSHKEISEFLTITETASRTLLVRARKNIQNLLYEKAMNQNIDKKKGKKKALLLLPLFVKRKNNHYIDNLVKKNWKDAPIYKANVQDGWKNLVQRLPNNIQNQILAKSSLLINTTIKMFIGTTVAVSSISGDTPIVSENNKTNLNIAQSITESTTNLTDSTTYENTFPIDTLITTLPTKTFPQTDVTIQPLTTQQIKYNTENQQQKETQKNTSLIDKNKKQIENSNQPNENIEKSSPIDSPKNIVNNSTLISTIPTNNQLIKTVNTPLQNDEKQLVKTKNSNVSSITSNQNETKTTTQKDTVISDSTKTNTLTASNTNSPIAEEHNIIEKKETGKLTPLIPIHEIKCMLGVFPYTVPYYYSNPYDFKSDLTRMLTYYDFFQKKVFQSPVYEYIRSYTIGSFALTYNHLNFKNHQLGGSISITTIVNQVYRDAAYTDFMRTYREKHLGLLAHYQYNYFDKKNIKLYSGIHIGCDISFDDQVRFSFDNLKPTGQLTLIGLTYGNRWFGNAELGIGNMGIVRLGVGYRFKEIK